MIYSTLIFHFLRLLVSGLDRDTFLPSFCPTTSSSFSATNAIHPVIMVLSKGLKGSESISTILLELTLLCMTFNPFTTPFDRLPFLAILIVAEKTFPNNVFLTLSSSPPSQIVRLCTTGQQLAIMYFAWELTFPPYDAKLKLSCNSLACQMHR